MSIIVKIDGSTVTHNFAPTGLSLTTRADKGEPSFGGIPFEDPDGDLVTIGHRAVTVEESSCSQPRLWTGWTTQRDTGRDIDLGLFVGPGPRIVDTTIVDMNACFGFRLIRGADGNRPAETWLARLTWLLGSDYLSGLIEDTGYIIAAGDTDPMDATDYRGSYPVAVLDDLVARTADANAYFAFWDPDAQAVSLFFDVIEATTTLSTLTISNDEGDADGITCFGPDPGSRLQREPDETWSGVQLTYRNGQVFRSRPTTETAFIRRETTTDRPHTGALSTATTQAERFLDLHGGELDRFTTTIHNVPAASVGLVYAGQRMNVRLTHLASEGYDDWTAWRVISCAPVPTTDIGDLWDIALELVQPRPASSEGGAGPTCSFEPPDPLAPASTSSLDAFGSAYSASAFAAADPVYPSSRVDGWTLHYGTPNNGSGWGLGTGVTGAGHGEERWTWDLDDIGIPPICKARLVIPSGDMEDKVSIEASDNGTDWTVVVSPAEINDEILFDIAFLTHRYWSVHYSIDFAGGYYAGLDISYFMLWAGTIPPGDTIVPLPLPIPSGTTVADTAPTVADDADHGFGVGSRWIDTSTTPPTEYVLTDDTPGAAVWVSTTASAGAPAGADYLVGTAQAGLSAEIVVGTTPGGELGGSWASPTVDATHSGSSHAGAASAAVSSHEGAADPHSGYVLESLVDAAGDLIVGSADNAVARLPKGVDGLVLTVSPSTHLPAWLLPPAPGELLVADGTSGPSGVLASVYDEMTSRQTTTSGSLADIPGVSTTITLQRAADIAVWMNLDCSTTGGAAAELAYAISIDGVDHDEVGVHLSAAGDSLAGPLVHRTDSPLAPGAHVVNGRFRRVSGSGTPGVDRADLLVASMALGGPVLITNDADDDYLYADVGA